MRHHECKLSAARLVAALSAASQRRSANSNRSSRQSPENPNDSLARNVGKKFNLTLDQATYLLRLEAAVLILMELLWHVP